MALLRLFFTKCIFGGSKESLLTKVPAISILHKDIEEVVSLPIQVFFIRNPEGTRSQGVENTHLLSREMMGISVKILLCVGLLTIHCVGERAVQPPGNKNIQEREAAICLLFHGELYGRGLAIEVIQETIELFMAIWIPALSP